MQGVRLGTQARSWALSARARVRDSSQTISAPSLGTPLLPAPGANAPCPRALRPLAGPSPIPLPVPPAPPTPNPPHPAFPPTPGRWHAAEQRSGELALQEARAALETTLPYALSGRAATVEHRLKSPRSIFEKATLRGKRVDDLCALRVIVDDRGGAAPNTPSAEAESQCHTVRRWAPTGHLDRLALGGCPSARRAFSGGRLLMGPLSHLLSPAQVRTLCSSIWPDAVLSEKDYISAPKPNS